MPLERMLPSLRTGCRVPVRRERQRRHEVTVQELVIEGERAWLWPRTSDPAHHPPTRLHWPLHGPTAAGVGEEEAQISIERFINATWQPEAAIGML